MPNKVSDNLIYSKVSAMSFSDRAALRVRKHIYFILSNLLDLNALDSVLDVGVTADKECLSSNYFENLYPFKERITALSDQPAEWLEEAYPGLRFVQGDGRRLPFADNSFDLVFSSAVLEHVGSRYDQFNFLQECLRVSRKYVFLTTPNRWHPLEFHTKWPFLHWLPSTFVSNVLPFTSYGLMVTQGRLNLLSKQDIDNMVQKLVPASYDMHYARFLGWKSNLLAFITK